MPNKELLSFNNRVSQISNKIKQTSVSNSHNNYLRKLQEKDLMKRPKYKTSSSLRSVWADDEQTDRQTDNSRQTKQKPEWADEANY